MTPDAVMDVGCTLALASAVGAFVARVVLDVRARRRRKSQHYDIIGGRTHEVIGCTVGDAGKADVLEAEPEATFAETEPGTSPECPHGRKLR